MKRDAFSSAPPDVRDIRWLDVPGFPFYEVSDRGDVRSMLAAGTVISGSDWRERIGDAVPPDAAQAIASEMGRTLLLAWSGETFTLSSAPIWVQPARTGPHRGHEAQRPRARRPSTARWSSCASRPTARPAGRPTTVRGRASDGR